MKHLIPVSAIRSAQHQTPDGYRVQYTDDAIGQKGKLDETLCNKIEETMHMIAAVNPYHHGIEQQDIRDRRRVSVDRATVLFVVSESVKVLTVVNIEIGSSPSDTSGGFAVPPSVTGLMAQNTGPFVGFHDTDDEDEDGAPDVQPVRPHLIPVAG